MDVKLDMTLSKGAVDFINDEYLHSLIENTKEDPVRIREIFAKSKRKQPLTVEETAARWFFFSGKKFSF